VGSTSTSFATASATPAWSTELTLAASIGPASGVAFLYGTWITIEAVGSAGGITASLDGIWVAEAELT